MSRLYIPVGIPGCGKSTFATSFGLGDYPAVVVSSDAIRESLGDVNDQSKNGAVFAAFHELIDFYLFRNGVDVFADATNLDFRARQTLRGLADHAHATTHLILFANLDEAILRNRKRDRVVPDDVMTRMIGKYERAKFEIWQEQYDSITEVRSVR